MLPDAVIRLTLCIATTMLSIAAAGFSFVLLIQAISMADLDPGIAALFGFGLSYYCLLTSDRIQYNPRAKTIAEK